MLYVDDLISRILEKSHGALYSTKLYHDLIEVFLWDVLKRATTEFVAKCPNCQQVKAGHQKSSGLLQEIQIKIPTWKWDDVNMDFVVGLP